MILVDTSIWVDVLRDRSGQKRIILDGALANENVVLTRFHQLELLQGARDAREWTLLSEYLDTQDYVEMTADSWSAAAQIYYDLRRAGKTVRSAIDCCIAQIAIEHGIPLLHRDRDFETIATVRPLRQRFLDW